jgi:hypothetical protein
MIVLATGVSAVAADYLRIDDDTVFMAATADLEFIATRECANPALIKGVSNGFSLTASGSATWTFNAFTPDPTANAWFDMTGILFTNYIDGVSPDSFLTGGVAINQGVPIVSEQLYFTLTLDVGPGPGQICIDSAFIYPAGEWLWDGLTCGHGDGRRPDFLDDELNTGSPFCITVWDTTGCESPVINVTPPGDELSGSHCSVLNFDFDASPGAGLYITGWVLISGPGTIDVATGDYEVGPATTGTYPVVIGVENNCGKTDDYAFNVVFTNNPPSFGPKADPPGTIAAGLVYGWDFDATDPDFCDELIYTTTTGSPTPTYEPTIDSYTGLFLWLTDEADAGKVFVFEIEVNDGQPDKAYDIYTLEIEVLGEPPICGDVDLSGSVDIDDIVYLVNYVFSGGPPPCEPDK